MKTLLVYRHAHARRATPEMDDHDRPLSERGERDARAMGRRLRGEGLVPDLAVASTAVRARETARLAAEAGGFADRVEAVSISGIREVFEAAGEDAINLGLGQPDFPTPEHAREAAISAIDPGVNGKCLK